MSEPTPVRTRSRHDHVKVTPAWFRSRNHLKRAARIKRDGYYIFIPENELRPVADKLHDLADEYGI